MGAMLSSIPAGACALWTSPAGLRVQAPFGARVQKVHKVQRVVVAPLIYRRRPLMIKPLQPPCGRWKTGQPPWRAMEMHFPFCGLRHHLPAPLGSVSLDSQSPTAPCESSSLATAVGRATKGKRLYGQARRLTSPDLHILCRMCTVDNKAPQSSPFISSSQHNGVLFYPFFKICGGAATITL